MSNIKRNPMNEAFFFMLFITALRIFWVASSEVLFVVIKEDITLAKAFKRLNIPQREAEFIFPNKEIDFNKTLKDLEISTDILWKNSNVERFSGDYLHIAASIISLSALCYIILRWLIMMIYVIRKAEKQRVKHQSSQKRIDNINNLQKMKKFMGKK